MFKRLNFLLFVCLTGSLGAQFNYPQDYFDAPLPIPLYLSGTFGELRSNHFHSGIDIKTNGQEGVPVVAAADGEVYRIKVSPYGFGNALYISHQNGYNTVYAHLQRFHPNIETYVRKAQYEQERFDVEVFPSRGVFSFKKGDTIAFSGNSGGSGGPHLHFEIRSARTEKIINPLLFGFDVRDEIYPKLNYLQVYTYNGSEMLTSEKRRLLKTSEGTYTLSGNEVLTFGDGIAFGLNVYDQLNGAPNKNGPFRIELTIDGKEEYVFQAETFAFNETRYINSHIDYHLKYCCRQVVNKLYLEPGNELSLYRDTEKMNIYRPDDDTLHQAVLAVSDVAGNKSLLSFKLERDKSVDAEHEPDYEEMGSVDLSKFSYRQTNFFKNDEVEFILPEGALYNDVIFEYTTSAACEGCLSKTYQLSSVGVGIQKYFTLKIKIPENLKGNTDKLCIVSTKNGRIADFEGARWDNGFISARTRQLGGFALASDTKAPVLKAVNAFNGKVLTSQKTLQCKMSDNLSGIKKYRATIDGRWVLMQYDAKNSLLTLDIEKEEIPPGQRSFLLIAEDKLGNESRLNLSLTF